MKYEIKYEFGIKMSRGDKEWGERNLKFVYASLQNINDKLNSKLKLLVNGSLLNLANITPMNRVQQHALTQGGRMAQLPHSILLIMRLLDR